MDATQTIRDAVARVSTLRQLALAQPNLLIAISTVKRIQAKRFSVTYADLLLSKEYGSAARFFLEELYSDGDFSQRDAQFSRIAKALKTFFPKRVVDTAVSLANLHILTEELDYLMAVAWLSAQGSEAPQELTERSAHFYLLAWRTVGRAEARSQQLLAVLSVGRELNRLTRTRGLRTMLKMMHGPANAAGLGALQKFLESGFDTFADMANQNGGADEFLMLIEQRESLWINQLFDSDFTQCEIELQKHLD